MSMQNLEKIVEHLEKIDGHFEGLQQEVEAALWDLPTFVPSDPQDGDEAYYHLLRLQNFYKRYKTAYNNIIDSITEIEGAINE